MTMTMTVSSSAPMKGSRFKGAWRLDGNEHADHADQPLRRAIDEHLAAELPDTFVSPGDYLDTTYDWGGALDVTPVWEDDYDLDDAECGDDCECNSCILPGILPGESYVAYYRRTELDDDGTIDLEAHEAGWGTVFDPDDLGWGFKVEDGFSIRRRGQSYAKAF